MKLKQYIFGQLLVFLAIFQVFPAVAEANENKVEKKYFAEINLGSASPQSSNFDNADFRNIYLGRHLKHFDIKLGYIDDMEFDSKLIPSSRITANGFSLGLENTFHINNTIGITPQLGAFIWEADATFLGVQAGKEDDISIWYGLSLHLKLHHRVSALMNIQRFRDVGGSHMNALSFGLMGHF